LSIDFAKLPLASNKQKIIVDKQSLL